MFTQRNSELLINTSRAGQAGGGTFRVEKNDKPKKDFAYRRCAGRLTNQRNAQTEFFSHSSLQPFRLVVAFWWWLVVFPWCAFDGDVMCCDVICHVMWLTAT